MKKEVVQSYREILQDYPLTKEHKNFILRCIADMQRKYAIRHKPGYRNATQDRRNDSMGDKILEEMEKGIFYTVDEIHSNFKSCRGLEYNKVIFLLQQMEHFEMVARCVDGTEIYYTKIDF